MNFDYYYGDESNQFAFYRIPRPTHVQATKTGCQDIQITKL